MNRSDTHLSTEALAAYVDGELAPGPHARAAEHIASCIECGVAVGIQAQTKQSLSHSSGTFAVPSGLLAKLGNIPYDAELPENDARSLSMSGAGVFEFSVAAPATPRDRDHDDEAAHQKRSRFGELRRARYFNRGAVLIALGVGLTFGPAVMGTHANTVTTDDLPVTNSVVGSPAGHR